MVFAICLTIAWIIVACALLILGSRWAETRYYRNHPPDDGCNEMKFDDDEEDWP